MCDNPSENVNECKYHQLQSLVKTLTNNILCQIGFTGRKLSTLISVTDCTKLEHQHDVLYEKNSPEENCADNYIGEIARPISERMIDLKGRERNSHIFKHNRNLGQNIIDKSTKLCSIGLSMECFTADFSQFLTQLFFLYLPISSISGMSLKFPTFPTLFSCDS